MTNVFVLMTIKILCFNLSFVWSTIVILILKKSVQSSLRFELNIIFYIAYVKLSAVSIFLIIICLTNIIHDILCFDGSNEKAMNRN